MNKVSEAIAAREGGFCVTLDFYPSFKLSMSE